MNTLPINAEDSALLTLLEEWTELLASAVYGYGCPGYTREEAARVWPGGLQGYLPSRQSLPGADPAER